MTYLLTLWALLSALAIGSFLNVVIHRGPIIWGLVARPDGLPKRFNLAWPRSHCPQCGQPIRLPYLLPLIGFILARGRCVDCTKPIGWRYLLVELLSLMGAVLALVLWGHSWLALFAFVFFSLLICLAFIDGRHFYLPDALTLPLIGSGLLVNGFNLFVRWQEALFGALLGFGLFYGLEWAYRRVRGRDGLGRGDAKLLAGLGAWCGALALPIILFLSASLALVMVSLQMLQGRIVTSQTALPYGPYLSAAGALVLIGEKLWPHWAIW